MSPVKRLAVNYSGFCTSVRKWDAGERDITTAREVWFSASGLRRAQADTGEELHGDELLAYYEQAAWQAIDQNWRAA